MTFVKNINKGVFYMLISAICLAFMSAFAKILSESLPTIEIVFFRNLIGITIILITFFSLPINQKGGKLFLLFFRGFIGFIAMLSFFYNIAHITLADAITFSRMSPVFTALFALWFLKEKIGLKGWSAIFIGFFGMLFVMQPFQSGFNQYHFFGILNAVCAALAFTSIRELKKYYDTRSIVISFMGIGLIIPIIIMNIAPYYSFEIEFLDVKFIIPKNEQWLFIFAIGLFSSLGQIFMTKAYGETRAGIVGAVGYTVILFSIIIGLFLGDLFPNLYALIGIFAIISSGIIIAKEKK